MGWHDQNHFWLQGGEFSERGRVWAREIVMSLWKWFRGSSQLIWRLKVDGKFSFQFHGIASLRFERCFPAREDSPSWVFFLRQYVEYHMAELLTFPKSILFTLK